MEIDAAELCAPDLTAFLDTAATARKAGLVEFATKDATTIILRHAKLNEEATRRLQAHWTITLGIFLDNRAWRPLPLHETPSASELPGERSVTPGCSNRVPWDRVADSRRRPHSVTLVY
jgi:hypothetical protein